MNAGSFAMIAAVSLMLLLFGCAGTQQQGSAPQPPQAAPGTGGGEEPPPNPPDIIEDILGGGNQAGTGGQQPAGTGTSCIVYFQRASSDIYIILVRNVTPSAASVTVKCPNGMMASDRGQGLFYCDRLFPNDNVTAYANGQVCGERSLTENSQAPEGYLNITNMGISVCSMNLSLGEVRPGGEFYADLAYATNSDALVEFECGGQVRQLAAGIGSRSLVCTFSQTGEQDVVLRVNGQPCAAARISVE